MPNKAQTEVIFCAVDGCDAYARQKTSTGMPLCLSHAETYELGQNNPKPLEEFKQDIED
jgi:hypothetical protein